MERSGGMPDQLAWLYDCCDKAWPGKGPDRVKKEIALLLLTKASKQGHQLRLHVVGHMLNVQLGRDWKHKYGVDVPLAQFLQSAPFRVVPTDIPNVDAVKLDVQQLLSPQRLHITTAHAHVPAAASSKVRVVPRPGNATIDGKPSPKAATTLVPSSSGGGGSHTLFSPKPSGVKCAAVLAYITSMRWHEQQHISMLRQALASNIVRKASGADGRIAAAADSQQYCVTAEHAAGVVERAWHGRYPAEPSPYKNLQDLLAGDAFLHLLPAADAPESSSSKGSSSNSTSHSTEARVQLNMQLLLNRMASKGVMGHNSPAAPLTPVSAVAKLIPSSTSASPNVGSNPAGEAAAAKLIGLLTGKAGKPAASAALSRAVGTAASTTAGSAAAAVATAGSQTSAEDALSSNKVATVQQAQQQNGLGVQQAQQQQQDKGLGVQQVQQQQGVVVQQSQQQQQQQGAAVPKKSLLNFIQRRQWDRGVDYNLMKRAVATYLVNKAADGAQECSLNPVSMHVAKAGEVFHMVWTGRHGPAVKPYKKVADVLGDDPFLTIVDGPQHARQLVQLDIKAMAVAAGYTAGGANKAMQAAETESGGRNESPAAVSPAAEALEHTLPQVDAGSSNSPTVKAGPAQTEVAGSETEAASADAASVMERAQTGSLLAVDLLAYAAELTWHESSSGLGQLRQQLAMMMIEEAHPGLAEAIAAGEQVAACTDAAQYAMSPYAAGSALMAMWQAKHPDQPRPYTTLPSALEGCTYLVLKLAACGYQAQLELQQYMQDCRAAMQRMQSTWQKLVSLSAQTVALGASAASLQPAAVGGAAAAATVPPASNSGLDTLQLSVPTSLQPIGQGSNSAAESPSSAAAVPESSSSAHHGFATSTTAGHAAVPSMHHEGLQQPQVPNMQQLLSLLSCAPPGVCQHAGVVWVPESVQHFMFTEYDSPSAQQESTHSSQRHAAAAWAHDGGYELYGIHKLQDAAGVNRMLDHLLACPILAVGCCLAHVNAATAPLAARGFSSGAGGAPAAVAAAKPHQLLLQVLAPPVVGHDSGSALDAAVYVFEVPRQKQSQQQQQSGGGGQDKLHLLLTILLEDARLVKSVDGQDVLQLLQEYHGINAAGVLSVNVLESMLGAREVFDVLADGTFDIGGLEGYVAAYKLTAGQLEGSQKILRSLLQRGCPEGKPISAELITTAASTVRPLIPLALSMLQLLPVALMRRCLMGAAV